MVKVIRIREKEKFLKKVYEMLDNWGLASTLWVNRVKGFFKRNLVKPHKAKSFVKLSQFPKKHSIKEREFKEFKKRVRGGILWEK